MFMGGSKPIDLPVDVLGISRYLGMLYHQHIVLLGCTLISDYTFISMYTPVGGYAFHYHIRVCCGARLPVCI
jgi:hypothetical protein